MTTMASSLNSSCLCFWFSSLSPLQCGPDPGFKTFLKLPISGMHGARTGAEEAS